MRAIALPETTRFTAILLLAVAHCNVAWALADGYYDTTWLGTGRLTFHGDYYDPEILTGPWSGLDTLLVRPDGSLFLAGAVGPGGQDSWVGEMSANGSWITAFGSVTT